MFLNLVHFGSIPTAIITAIVRVTNNLFELLLVKAKQFIKHLLTLDRWLGITYLVKFQPMCLINVLKTLPSFICSLIFCHKLD